MRVMFRHCNFVDEPGAQSLNCPPRGQIIGITSNSDRLVNGTHEGRNGATRLERIAMPAMLPANFETNVSGGDSNVFSIANAKIDVANITIAREQYAKMICRNEIARRVTGN
jgi:hypothetical protein